MIPKPICFQFRTLSRCSFKGCNSNPSSKTSLRALTHIGTHLSNSSKSNSADELKTDQ